MTAEKANDMIDVIECHRVTETIVIVIVIYEACELNLLAYDEIKKGIADHAVFGLWSCVSTCVTRNSKKCINY